MARKQPHLPEAMLPPGHPLSDIVEEAYRTFSYPTPKSTEVCEACCMNTKIAADFFNPPIRALPLTYLQDWYSAAYSPNGVSKQIWGYLLPRILEMLAANEDVCHVGIEVVLKRFDTGNPAHWTRGEWQVLDAFQRAYLGFQMMREEDHLDDVVCMFRLGGWPLDALLAQVTSAPAALIARRLWADWCDGLESIWTTAFWEKSDNARMLDFYTSRELYDRMEALALSDHVTADLAAKASAVAGVIETSAHWSLRHG
ncbi:MAG: hypothetical protein J7494_07065 [Sphingobium sp.]|nr:hypothetical protein [Sphingobium sp.]